MKVTNAAAAVAGACGGTPAELEAAVSEFITQVESRSTPADVASVAQALDALRGERRFDLLGLAAQALVHAGQSSLYVQRQYVQSLLEQGHLVAAIAVLEPLIEDADGVDVGEHAELSGLLGRAHKQIYVNARGHAPWLARSLRSAIDAYWEVYQLRPELNLWHGSNAAALLHRAEQDGVAVDQMPRAADLAGELLTTLKNRTHPNSDPFSLTIATEACLATGNHEGAMRNVHAFATHEKVTAFHAGSFLRQLQELWRLNVSEPPGASILPLVRSLLFAKDGGVALTVHSSDVHASLERNQSEDLAFLQAVLGDDGVESYRWWMTGVARAAGVGRIAMQASGEGIGTGFLVRGSDLNPAWDEQPLLVTNAHVVSSDPSVDAAEAGDVEVTFEARDEHGDKVYAVDNIVKTSAPGLLDYSILKLTPQPTQAQAFPLHSRLPNPGKRSRVYVIGHPKGGGLSFSFQDNELLDHDRERYLHYRTPTEPGSSGSPLFNAQWKLIGLHHAGGHSMRKLNGQPGTYAANEGIWIQAVRKDVAG